jgi:drug/metabolite transporter (DMT)-like permease
MAFDLVLLAAFGAMFCWGIGDFLIQRTVRRIGDVEALMFLGLIQIFGLFPFVLNDFSLLFSMENLLVLFLLGVITFVGALVTFEAFKKGKISVVEVVIEFELPVTIVLGFIFFGEFLSIWQLLLIVPIFLGIILMAVGAGSKRPNNPFERIEKGILLGFLAAIGMGLINSFTALSARQVSPVMAIWFPAIFLFVISLVVLIKQNRFGDSVSNLKKFPLLIIAMGLVDAAAWVFYAFSLSSYNVGVITAITESYPVIGLILGVFVNKEKISRHQYLGAALAIFASLLLAATLL